MNESLPPSSQMLVAVDYSDLSALAVKQAVALTHQEEVSTLHFVHVAKASESSDTQRQSQKVDLQKWLTGALQKSGALFPETAVVAHLVHGTPADCIVQLASDLLADLVVIGTHGRTGVSRMVVGSVAELVVRNCGCTVLVTRKKDHHSEIPRIAPPCPRCVAARKESGGEQMWCEQHNEKHGRRHTYYNPRAKSWVTKRLSL